MDSLPSVSHSISLLPTMYVHHRSRRQRFACFVEPSSRFPSLSTSLSSPKLLEQPNIRKVVYCKSDGGGGGGFEEKEGKGEDKSDEVVERALRMDGKIPGTSDEFVKQVSSRAYDMRRHLHQSIDSSSYDVLDDNPWRESSKPVYVLTHKENQLCTMKTRRNRSEVEKELGMLFNRGRKRAEAKPSRPGMNFQMFVEDVRDGILVFEDQNEAVRYCDLLQGGGQGCEGVAEIEASSVFDLCRKSRALAVLFRRGRIPPQPENLQLNLRARKHSLED